MCGLAGVLNLGGDPLPDGRSPAIADALRHRGPDAEGVFVDDGATPAVALVQRSLSIIDLSHGADQPLGNGDGSIQVALNGEIYNFHVLRAELFARHKTRGSAAGARPRPLREEALLLLDRRPDERISRWT